MFVYEELHTGGEHIVGNCARFYDFHLLYKCEYTVFLVWTVLCML